MEIDLSAIPTDNPLAFAWWFFVTIGWIYPVFLFVYGLILWYQAWIRAQYKKGRSYILLAVDVPKGNEQTPKAVENMFNHLHGAHQPLKFHHKWWKGEVPESFSFEIVSIGGYIQFIINLERHYRDLIEAMIYAQYPDAEITEIEDYTQKYAGIKFPNERYDLFGSEVILTNKQWYPIITHGEFEDTISGELKDPLASLLEALGRVGPGEEIWVQVLVTPADNDWGKPAKAEINKIIGAKDSGKKTILDRIFELPGLVFDTITPAPAHPSEAGREPPNMMLYLTEGEKSDVKAIQHKTSRTGFHTRIRYVYIAEKAKYTKERAFQGIYGALKQFNSLGSNGFKNDTRFFTGAIVYFKKTRLRWRKNKMLYRCRWRGHWFMPGEFGKILIAEELASLWHFPMITTKAPLVQKTEAKKGEPPISLPTADNIERPHPTTPKATPPANLPTA